MSFLSSVTKLYRAFIVAWSLMHRVCKLVERIDAKVQASNATDAVKTASTNFLAATNTFCSLLDTHKEDLADGQIGN